MKRGFQFVPVPGGLFLLAPQPNDYKDDDGNPSQPGDVVTVTKEGDIQVRRPTDPRLGPWEHCERDGITALFTNQDSGLITVLVPDL